MNQRSCLAAVLAAVVITFCAADPATAMTLKEFRKFSTGDQGTYIGAAVSMLVYFYAANGDTPRARCVQSWYYGKDGAGPRHITVEISVKCCTNERM